METILHLFITNTCRHDCPLCCNKLYVIDKIPVVTVELLKRADTVCLTGGEPLLIHEGSFYTFTRNLRMQYPNIKNLYVYTSGYGLQFMWRTLEQLVEMKCINGINVAPKDKLDWWEFQNALKGRHGALNGESNRLYVFDEQRKNFEELNLNLEGINIEVLGRKWQQVFNTPDNEYFVRLPILF